MLTFTTQPRICFAVKIEAQVLSAAHHLVELCVVAGAPDLVVESAVGVVASVRAGSQDGLHAIFIVPQAEAVLNAPA